MEHDDFQFKPLTEGLGFHPKSNLNSPPPPKNGAPRFQLEDLELNAPLPRKPMTLNSSPQAASANTVDEILKTLSEKRKFDFSEKSKLHEPQTITYKPSRFDLSAGLLDGMLVTATTLLCLIILLAVTRVDLFANLYHPDAQLMVYASLALMVAGITWIYLVANRLFLGCTPGEWVFDQRLGKPEQLGTGSYALKITIRTTMVVATGFILLPALSFLINSDLLGKLTGAELLKKV